MVQVHNLAFLNVEHKCLFSFHEQFLLILSSLLFFFLIKNSLLKSRIRNPKCPPGPLPFPLIGSLHCLAGRLPFRAFSALAREYGPLMLIKLGQVDFVVASSREAAEQILKIQDPLFASRPQITAANLLIYGGADIVFSPYGPYWKQLRRLCHAELLSPRRIADFTPARQVEILMAMREIETRAAAGSVNLSRLLSELSNNIVARAAFGQRSAQQDRFIPVMMAMVGFLGGLMVADAFPSLKFLDVATGASFRMRRLHKIMDDILSEIIKEHKSKAARGRGADEVDDLVDVLLGLKGDIELEFPLTMQNTKAVIFDMFVGGTVTSWATMDWAMAELIRDPKRIAIAQKEVRETINGNNRVEERDLVNLHYLKAIIKETLRLHPPAPLIPRQCTKTCQVLDYEIKAGTRVFVNLWAMGRDPQYWPEPEQFKPERFLSPNASVVDFSGSGGHFEYVPFGAGRRICPALGFAMATVELVLAHLLLYFDWKLPPGIAAEELDMSETFGLAGARKIDLKLLAFPSVVLPDVV